MLRAGDKLALLPSPLGGPECYYQKSVCWTGVFAPAREMLNIIQAVLREQNVSSFT